MIKTIKLSIVGLLIIVSSCKDVHCDNIISKIQDVNCNSADEFCLFDFKVLNNNRWNYLYIFPGFYTPEDISEIVGINYEGKVNYDPSKLFLFLKNNEVIDEFQSECFNINFDKLINNGYVKIDYNNSILKFTLKANGEKSTFIFDNY